METYELKRAIDRLDRWVSERRPHVLDTSGKQADAFVRDVSLLLEMVRSGSGATLPGLTVYDLYSLVRTARYDPATLDLPVSAEGHLEIDADSGRPVWRLEGLSFATDVTEGFDYDDFAGIPSEEWWTQSEDGRWVPANGAAPWQST